jgi:hypothetical protein
VEEHSTDWPPQVIEILDDAVKLSIVWANNITQRVDHYFLDIVHAIGGVVVANPTKFSVIEDRFDAVIECVRRRGLDSGSIILSGRYPYSQKMLKIGMKLQVLRESDLKKRLSLFQWMDLLTSESEPDDWKCFQPIGIDHELLMDELRGLN